MKKNTRPIAYISIPISYRAKKLTYFGAENKKKLFDSLYISEHPYYRAEKLPYFGAENEQKIILLISY